MATPEAHVHRRLEGKVAIITGGASGIGAATAKLFVENGARVVIADIQEELGLRVATELGEHAEFFRCDVTQESDVAALVDHTVTCHGTLHIMFNNAGIATPTGSRNPLADLDIPDFDRTMSVNVRGVMLGFKHGARAMLATGTRGCLLCTSSVAGVLAQGGGHPYTVSKHAVLGVMRSAASEMSAYGIRVNAVSPYVLETPLVRHLFGELIPAMRDADQLTNAITAAASRALHGAQVSVHDIAAAVLFLASDEAQFINGHNLIVDGGFTISKPLHLLA